MRFTYSSGQRPLDGFTIKRGVGRGGFGEVYFAVSDGGKEVALKLLRGENHIELRGVAQCMNLKHPNLVAIYDLRTDSQGDNWVVMEYVAGEALNVVLQRHPQGLPRELAREWFLGLARAVGYLHDHGIVHRDLKPANVFIENGQVKVGDYGLSKSLTNSQGTANTHSIGTVHYMAPEIGSGKYNKQIDVYAAGVVFYEMLTGHVPFDGETPSEILMKHLTTPPDLGKVPAEYLGIVAKALAKNPSQRYGSMAEMARAVEAVARATPPPLPVPPVVRRPVPPPPIPDPRPTIPVRSLPSGAPEPILTVLPAFTMRDKIGELMRALPLTVLFAAVATVLWKALDYKADLNSLGTVFFLIVAVSWAVLIPSKFWADRRGESWTRRFVLMLVGGLIGFGALWLDGWSPGQAAPLKLAPDAPTSVVSSIAPTGVINEASYISYFGLAFFALRWWRMADRRRFQRFSFFPVLAAAFWGLVLLLVGGFQMWYGAGVLMISAAVVQLVSPWEPPPPPPARRMRLRYT
ncbi:MAG TPA: serine/threonine-protein kinase [Gemmataceae bacterium]|nr:serine/threonine-protein kinase [Gemmataceae bacterium]